MIQKESFLKVADNSGAQLLQCFHIYGGSNVEFAYPGDIIKCSVKKAIPNSTVKKGDKVTVVIVRTRKEFRRADGSYISFGDNAGVLIKSVDDLNPIGSRISGPVVRELKAKNFAKIISLAPEVL